MQNKKVFILVSGGVDSNVAFALLTNALGEKRVKGLYIDTGFMRMKESEEILDNFNQWTTCIATLYMKWSFIFSIAQY